MADYDIRPLQLHVLENLKIFHEVCQRHGLRYFITAGTMLGAVRHKGFIPWDDDLDVAMPRRDYDLLIANSRQWLPKPLELVCAENNPDYPLPFAKLQDASTTLLERPHLPFLGGVYMDVFPLDGVRPSWSGRHWQFSRYEYLKRALYFIHRDPYKHGHGASSWLPLLTRRLYTPQGLQKAMRAISTAVDYDSARLCADYDDGLRGVMPRTVFGNPTPIRFEDTEVMGYGHPDEYLSRKYGSDYMQIPPDGHRRQHNFFLLDLNTPYEQSRSKVREMIERGG